MTMARGIRCKNAKTADCLNCPYEQCVHDLEDMEAVKSYIVAVHDDFRAEVFNNATEGARWLIDNNLSNNKIKNLSGQIRNFVNRCVKKYDVAWYRVDEMEAHSSFKYTYDNKLLFTFFDSKKNAWRIVKKNIGEKIVVPLTRELYKSQAIAQIVLDVYADEHDLRIIC